MKKEPQNQIIIYEGDDGNSRIEVRLDSETVWLTQAQLVELFNSSKANISEHIKHIFEENELDRDSVVRKFRTTAGRYLPRCEKIERMRCFHSYPPPCPKPTTTLS